MGHAIAQLLEALLSAARHTAEWLPHVASSLLRLVARTLEAAALPETLLVLVLSLALAFGTVSAIALVHAFAFSRRRTRVFLSYQHDRCALAQHLARSMEAQGIVPILLPFLEDPEHDSLLENVRGAIQQCDVLLCIPGRQGSFVEHEVSMALGLNRPMVFMLDDDHQQIPNTAKHGYPLFDADKSRGSQHQHLARFCSYLGGDAMSTLRLYLSVFQNLKACALFIGVVFAVLTSVATGYLDLREAHPPATATEAVRSAILSPVTAMFFSVAMALLTIPYLTVTLTRHLLRQQVRRAISGRRFEFRLLPSQLEYGFTRAQLEAVRFAGPPRAHHELQASSADHAPRTTIPLNRGKMLLHLLVIPVGLAAYAFLFARLLEIALDSGSVIMWIAFATFWIPGLFVLIHLYSWFWLLRAFFRGRDLVLSKAGFSESLEHDQNGLVSWLGVTSARLDENSIVLVRDDPPLELTIDLQYYAADPSLVLAIVQDHIASSHEPELRPRDDA